MEFIFIFLPSYFFIIFLAKGKSVNLLILCLSDIAPKIAGFSIKYISRTKWWNSLPFSMLIEKIKSWLENIGVIVVKSGCDHPGHIVNEEWMDKLSWFFACWCKFTKVKNYFQNFWVILVKNESHPLISEWMSESS